MVGGLIVVVVLAAASAVGFVLRLRQGRFRAEKPRSGFQVTSPAGSDRAAPAGNVLTAEDLGAPLGERATLVQFSSEVCVYCGPTRELLAEVARERDGVSFVEIDAARRMDLARRLRVLSTPTVLLLGADGAIVRRSSGKPRKSELAAALTAVASHGTTESGDGKRAAGRGESDSGARDE